MSTQVLDASIGTRGNVVVPVAVMERAGILGRTWVMLHHLSCDGLVQVTFAELQARLCCSRAAVAQAMATLEDMDLIRRVSAIGKPGMYTLERELQG